MPSLGHPPLDAIESGAAVECPYEDCSVIYQATVNGVYYKTPSNALVLNCVGESLQSYGCFWARWSLNWVQNGNDPYFVGDARWQFALGQAGQMADSELKSAVANMAVTDTAYVGGWYAPEIGSFVSDASQTALEFANETIENPDFIENMAEFLDGWDPAFSVPTTIGGKIGFVVSLFWGP